MSDESPSGKKVYFLGAGASNDSGFDLPTMQGFFRLKDICKTEYSHLKAFIDINFPKIPLQEINLEDVITYLELSMDRFGSFGKRPDSNLLDARKQFDQLVQERLSYPPKGKKFSSENFEHIFQGLEERKNDSVITLNYDLIVENTLNQISLDSKTIKYHLLYDRMVKILRESGPTDVSSLRENWSNGLFLKLHGSLEWYQCPHKDCPDYSRIIIPDEYHKDDPRICGVCGADLEVVIVPPAMNKSFDRWPRLGLVWRLAREELAKAAEVIFIGVSFAQSDYYLRWLIKSSFLESDDRKKKKTIRVVDECLSVEKKIRGMVDIEPTHYSSIQEYIDKVIGKKIVGS